MRVVFNPKNNPDIFANEILEDAMKVQTKRDAEEYLSKYIDWVDHIQAKERSQGIIHDKTPEEVAKSNLGYLAGYYSDEVRARIELLFECEHPIFGPIAKGKPTPEEAFNLGVKMAQRWREIKGRFRKS